MTRIELQHPARRFRAPLAGALAAALLCAASCSGSSDAQSGAQPKGAGDSAPAAAPAADRPNAPATDVAAADEAADTAQPAAHTATDDAPEVAADRPKQENPFSAVTTAPGQGPKGVDEVVELDKDGVLAGKDPGGAGKMTLHDGLAACLVANREKLAFVVASMDLTPSGEGAWLVPHHSSYCYVQGGAGAAGYLAVLSVVDEGRDVSKLGRNVDPALCDGKHDTCVAYHKRVFLEHVVRPQLKDGYPGATDASFLMVGDEIYAVPLLCCPPVRYGLIDYEPFLWSMKVAVSASHVTTEAMGSFAIKGLPDATASFKVSTSATCSYDAAGGVLSMKAAEEPKTSSSTHIPWYDYLIAGPFLLLIGGIVGAIAGVIVGVVIAVVTDAIAGKSDRQTKAESGSLALADWTAARIAWPGSERWRVDEVTLSDALVLRCTLKEPA